MNDCQILELSKARNLDNELNGILDKITWLASLVPIGGYEVQEMLDKAIILRTEMSKRKEKFITELQTIMLERDTSESKIKNLSSSKIEIPKFSGYSSKIDTHFQN